MNPFAYILLAPEYFRRFGHGIPRALLRQASLAAGPAAQISQQIMEALQTGRPVPGWQQQYERERQEGYEWWS